MLFDRALVIVRGGGDIASGVVYRLHLAGFPVIITELNYPLFVRRAVSYGNAVYENEVSIAGVRSVIAGDPDHAQRIVRDGDVAVLIDREGTSIQTLKPAIVVDARIAKVNLGTVLTDAPLVVALGPGFTAGEDCHAVVETNRGHNLGRVYWHGQAEPNTGEPGIVNGKGHSRVLRAPCDGHVRSLVSIGDMIGAGQTILYVQDEPVVAQFNGVVRGLIHEEVEVTTGMKIGDLDPRSIREHCFTLSDKALSIGGGVLEAVFSAEQVRQILR